MSSAIKNKNTKGKYYRPQTIKTVSRQSLNSRPNLRSYKKVKATKKRTGHKNPIKALLFNRSCLKFFSTLFILGIIAIIIFVSVVSRNIPNPNQLIDREIAQSTTIYDRNGEHILYEFHGEEKRTLVKLEDVPAYVGQATIAIEDKNFYKHKGFSVWAMFRTLVTNILYNQKAGGSTLTQQFVKNALLTSEKKFSRKVKEIIIAQKIEKKFNKDEILQMYLNEIPYGSNTYGIEAASQKYFGKSAKDISLAESAVLAALPQAPSRYSPYGPNKDLLLGRQQYILNLMEEQGYISVEERDRAKAEEVKFKGPETNIIAPHFVMYIKEILSEKYGEKEIEQGGFKIYTTLDFEKQKIAEEAVKKQAEINASKYNANNAALVAIDPKTGQILAMLGSKDYFNQDIDGQVNVSVRLRQPGSSLKPFVYAAMFKKGYTPDTILYDVITNFSTGTPYEPRNYNGQEYGPISARKALAGSLNTPAVKALYLAGINNVSALAKEAGYTTLDNPEQYGLSLVLGGADVKMIEHVNAYSIFAREGEVNSIASILKIEDKNGKVIEEWQAKKRNVFDANISRMINSILSDNSARSFIFGEKNNLTIPGRTVAVKTGTTNDFKDAWTIGYTPSIISGVWVGNNDSSKMNSGADGSVVAAPIWNEFMRKVLEGTPNETFKEPEIKKTGKAIIDGELIGRTIKINKEDGSIATENTPDELIEEKFFPEHHSILYYVNPNDPLGENPKKPEKDPQFALWENRVLEWAKKKDPDYNPDIINQADNLYNPENKPIFEIINLKNNQTIENEFFNVKVKASAPRGVNKIEYYINDNLLERKTSFPFDLEKNISFLENAYYTLKVKVCDDVLNCSEQSLNFNLLLSNNSKLPISLNLNSPFSGSNFDQADFPVNIQMFSTNPEQITKINLILESENGKREIIKSTNEILEKEINMSWSDKPEEGTYKIFAEFFDWNDKARETNKIKINIR